MSHHSAQDFAAMSAIPNMRVYCPSDRHQTKKLIEALLCDEKPAYLRVGRNPVEDVYDEENVPFELNRATVLSEGDDVLIVASLKHNKWLPHFAATTFRQNTVCHPGFIPSQISGLPDLACQGKCLWSNVLGYFVILLLRYFVISLLRPI